MAVARALVSRPQIVFADEPTGNLDSRSGAEVLSFMRRSVDEFGQSIAMVTHDPTAAAYAHRVIFLADGKIVESARGPDSGVGARCHARAGRLIMIKLSLQNTWAHKRRLVGTFMAVLIGVGFLSGTLILGDTLRDNFDEAVRRRLRRHRRRRPPRQARRRRRTTTERLQASTTLDASLVQTIEAVDGVRVAVAETQTYGQIIGKDGETIGGNGPPTFAASWNTDEGINPYHIIKGRAPKAPEEVVIDDASADAGKLKVGDTATVLLPEPLKVEIVGMAQFGDEPTARSVSRTRSSPPRARRRTSPRSRARRTRSSVAADDGVSQEDVARPPEAGHRQGQRGAHRQSDR